MNPRMLNIVLLTQALFAGALLYAGYASREGRRIGYLELTHRVTAGQATIEDFDKLTGFLPEISDKPTIRVLFGLPVIRATALQLKDTAEQKGDFWIYYPLMQSPTLERPAVPIDAAEAEKLAGPVTCFIFEFDARGRAAWRKEIVVHPIHPPSAIPLGK